MYLFPKSHMICTHNVFFDNIKWHKTVLEIINFLTIAKQVQRVHGVFRKEQRDDSVLHLHAYLLLLGQIA